MYPEGRAAVDHRRRARDAEIRHHRVVDWHAAAAGSWYEVVHGAGHNANQDHPEEFKRIILEFLARITRVNRGPAELSIDIY